MLSARDEKQTALRQPIDATRKTAWRADDDRAVAITIGGHALVSAPAREPKTVLVPPW